MKLLTLWPWQRTRAVQPALHIKLCQDSALTRFFTRLASRLASRLAPCLSLVPLWLSLHLLFVSTVTVANTPATDGVALDDVPLNSAVDDPSLDDVSLDDAADGQAEESVEAVADNSVLDQSHSYVTARFDSLARWIDGYFGVARTDIETAHSFVRVRYDNLWEESGETANNIRVRGKVNLPLLDERLKLVFFDEDEDLLAQESLEELGEEQDNSGGVGLQYNIAERQKFRIDYRLGLRSGSQLRTGVRGRYTLPINDRALLRLTENIYWQDTRGFGSTTTIEADYSINERQLIRWTNRLDFGEESPGLPWQSVLSLSHVFKENHAVAYYIRASGDTRPDYITTDYGPGFLYRINLWKKWFYVEFEPNYLWRRLPETNKHEGVLGATLRFEVLFSEDYRQVVYPD